MKVRVDRPHRPPTAARGAWLFGSLCFAAVILAALDLISGPSRADVARAPGIHGMAGHGHRLLPEFLRAAGHEVSESGMTRPLAEIFGPLLVVFEPTSQQLERLLQPDWLHESERDVLVVLPKWKVRGDPDRPGFVRASGLRPARDVLSVIDAVIETSRASNHEMHGIDPRIERAQKVPRLAVRGLSRDLDIDRRALARPSLANPQLIRLDGWNRRSDEVASIIGNREDGALLVRVNCKTRAVWILSDPDVLANHGLGDDGNAAFTAALFGALAGPRGPVAFDVTAQGLGGGRSFWQRMMQPPFVWLLLQLAVIGIAWFLSGFLVMPRRPRERTPGDGSIESNQRFAAVLAARGELGHALETLIERERRRVLTRLRLSRVPPDARVQSLQVHERRLGITPAQGIEGIEQRARRTAADRAGRKQITEALALAHELDAWSRRMRDGNAGAGGADRSLTR